jgi:hypothetical protein
MKIKTLAIAAATLAVGAISSQAQVYSQNIVGYINVTVPPSSYVLIQNPLDTGNNVLTNVIPLGSVPKNTSAIFFTGGSFSTTFLMTKSGWSPDASTFPVVPGAGFFLQNTATTNLTVTFTGSVVTNNIHLVAGYNLVGSIVPASGPIETGLGLGSTKNDYVYQWLTGSGSYTAQYLRTKSGWSPSEPNVGTNSYAGVAEGFFFNESQAAGTNWVNTAGTNLYH